MTTQQLAYDLFESEELRTLFIRAAMTSFGGAPHDVIGLHGLVHALGLVLSWEPAAIAKGGSQSISNALLKAFEELGGEVYLNCEVVKLLREGGIAKGIKLRDGTEVESKVLVAGDISALQALQLIGEEYLDPKIVRRIKNIRYDRHKVVWAVFALHELPKYKASSFNPDCEKAPRTYLCPKNSDYLANLYLSEIYVNGIASKLFMFLGPDSIWDESRAPKGKHIIGIEEFSATVRFFSPSKWQELRVKFHKEIIKQWQIYAPNMKEDNVIASRIYTPYDIFKLHPNMHEGSIACGDMIISQLDRFRPIPEMSSYRTPIKNFYLCSSATHNGVGTGRGCSYNCFQIICKDFGLQMNI